MIFVEVFASPSFQSSLNMRKFNDAVRTHLAEMYNLKKDSILIVFPSFTYDGPQVLDTSWVVRLSLFKKNPAKDMFLSRRLKNFLKVILKEKEICTKPPKNIVMLPPYGLSFQGKLPEEDKS